MQTRYDRWRWNSVKPLLLDILLTGMFCGIMRISMKTILFSSAISSTWGKLVLLVVVFFFLLELKSIFIYWNSRWIRSCDIFFIFRDWEYKRKKNEDVSTCVSKICKIGIRASEQDIKIELYLLTTVFGHLLSFV